MDKVSVIKKTLDLMANSDDHPQVREAMQDGYIIAELGGQVKNVPNVLEAVPPERLLKILKKGKNDHIIAVNVPSFLYRVVAFYQVEGNVDLLDQILETVPATISCIEKALDEGLYGRGNSYAFAQENLKKLKDYQALLKGE